MLTSVTRATRRIGNSIKLISNPDRCFYRPTNSNASLVGLLEYPNHYESGVILQSLPIHRAGFLTTGHCTGKTHGAATPWLRATDMSISIFQDYRLIASHVRSRRPGDRRTVLDHLPPEARAFFAKDRQWCLQQARAVGPACAELIDQLLGDRIVERLRGAQGVLGFLGEGNAQTPPMLPSPTHDTP